MSRRDRSKIATDGAGADLGNNPFGGLNLSGLPEAPKTEASAPRVAKKTKPKGRVEVRREKAGRGGKTVTTLREFPTHVPLSELGALTFDLKKSCACGGTLKGRVVELQGDVRDRAFAELEKRGFQPVRAGG
ncbi:MAG: translation initiation factor [Opitutaceae bacterium]